MLSVVQADSSEVDEKASKTKSTSSRSSSSSSSKPSSSSSSSSRTSSSSGSASSSSKPSSSSSSAVRPSPSASRSSSSSSSSSKPSSSSSSSSASFSSRERSSSSKGMEDKPVDPDPYGKAHVSAFLTTPWAPPKIWPFPIGFVNPGENTLWWESGTSSEPGTIKTDTGDTSGEMGAAAKEAAADVSSQAKESPAKSSKTDSKSEGGSNKDQDKAQILVKIEERLAKTDLPPDEKKAMREKMLEKYMSQSSASSSKDANKDKVSTKKSSSREPTPGTKDDIPSREEMEKVLAKIDKQLEASDLVPEEKAKAREQMLKKYAASLTAKASEPAPRSAATKERTTDELSDYLPPMADDTEDATKPQKKLRFEGDTEKSHNAPSTSKGGLPTAEQLVATKAAQRSSGDSSKPPSSKGGDPPRPPSSPSSSSSSSIRSPSPGLSSRPSDSGPSGPSKKETNEKELELAKKQRMVKHTKMLVFVSAVAILNYQVGFLCFVGLLLYLIDDMTADVELPSEKMAKNSPTKPSSDDSSSSRPSSSSSSSAAKPSSGSSKSSSDTKPTSSSSSRPSSSSSSGKVLTEKEKAALPTSTGKKDEQQDAPLPVMSMMYLSTPQSTSLDVWNPPENLIPVFGASHALLGSLHGP